MRSWSKILLLQVTTLALCFPPFIITSNTAIQAALSTDQPTGPHASFHPGLPCESYSRVPIDCPDHTSEDNDMMAKFMKECLVIEEKGNTYGVTCVFFPLEYSPKTQQLTSCHRLDKDRKKPCLFGFRIRPSRLSRRGNADDAYISVQFFGKIPPFPSGMTHDHTSKGYDVAEYIAFGISPSDKIMGDDLVIYCHPYMDRMLFPFNKSEVNPLYPEEIGVGINKYFTTGTGKQAYDAERNFNGRTGQVKAGHVTYWEGADASKPSWGVLDCKADISTYILLKSRQELFTGIELDMEKTQSANMFLAMGHCLQQECLGDHMNNTGQLAEIARRTSPMSYHKKFYIWEDPVTLFQQIDVDGREKVSGGEGRGGGWKGMIWIGVVGAQIILMND